METSPRSILAPSLAGQCTSAGTLCPPSQVVPLPQRNSPEAPPWPRPCSRLRAPLSEVNTILETSPCGGELPHQSVV